MGAHMYPRKSNTWRSMMVIWRRGADLIRNAECMAYRGDSPLAGSILTAKSVAAYTSTSPSHRHSIQKLAQMFSLSAAPSLSIQLSGAKELLWLYILLWGPLQGDVMAPRRDGICNWNSLAPPVYDSLPACALPSTGISAWRAGCRFNNSSVASALLFVSFAPSE